MATRSGFASSTAVQEDLRRVIADSDRPPTPVEYEKEGEHCIGDVYDHWESWRVAIDSVGGDSAALPRGRNDMDAMELWDRLVGGIRSATSVRDWARLLSNHIRFGNRKMQHRIAIFNVGSATECPNLNTEHCQVPDGACYAKRDEHLFPHTLFFRRRQGYLWDCLDADTFADAFIELVERKQKPVDYLRFNESGDIRHREDVIRINNVARRVAEVGVTTFTYTASDFVDLPTGDERHAVINGSNADVTGADQRFIVVDSPEEIPDDGYRCPFPEKGTQCGECLACLHAGGSGDVYEVLRHRKHADIDAA